MQTSTPLVVVIHIKTLVLKSSKFQLERINKHDNSLLSMGTARMSLGQNSTILK